MDSRPRNWSKELPPDLSELMNKLTEYANSFIREFDNKQPKVREIVGEFEKVAGKLKGVKEGRARRAGDAGAVGVGIGMGIGIGLGVGMGILGIGILASPLTGGTSLVAAAAAAAEAAAAALAAGGAGAVAAGAVAGAAGVALGGAVVVDAIRKKMKKNSAEKVEKLGKKFMEIIEPLKKNLKEIKTTCEKLEQKSVEVQAQNILRNVEEFQRILGRVAELGTRDDIIQSADQCRMIINEFGQIEKELKRLTGK